MLNVYALCGGLIDLDRSGFFCDVAPGTRMTVPVICFLIGHPRGNVLVDTGVHRQALTDPVGRLGEGRASRFRLRSKPSDEVVSQLALLDLAPEDMRYSPSPIDFDLPLDYQLIDGEHDVFGDGQVVLLPTYGHTPGHQSVRVRAGRGTDFVLTADACYTQETMDRDVLPNTLWDPAEMSRSLARLREYRDRQGATVVYGHDAAQWQELSRAPAPLRLAV